MKKPPISLQSVGVGIVAVVAIVVFAKTVGAYIRSKPTQLLNRRYHITLLSDEEGSPGKVIRAIRDGRVIGSYTCTNQDAEVAWLYDDDATSLDHSDIVLTSYDSRGIPFPSLKHQVGHAIRITVPRGYSTRPDSLSIPVLEGVSTPKFMPKTKNIKLTHFAVPVRCLMNPTPVQEPISRSILTAKAEQLSNGCSYMNYQPAHRHEFLHMTILSSTYCPEGSQIPDLYYYGSQTEAVKMRVDRYELVDKVTYLVYRNAQIVTINGNRTLRLPTTQIVGLIGDATAIVEKLNPIASKKTHDAHSIGELLVRLRRVRHPEVKYSPIASFASLDPDIDSLGLDLLRFRLVDFGFGEDLLPHIPVKSASMGTIPEIKIGIKITTPVRISTNTIVVPIEHTKQVRTENSQGPQNHSSSLLHDVEVYLVNRSGPS